MNGMIERFPEPTRTIMTIAEHEADRLGHNYIGCEHLLVALALQADTFAGRVLADHGLDPDVIRAQLNRLVDVGVLPPPWHNDIDLLRGLGVDLHRVMQAARAAFGDTAVDDAARDVSRRAGWTPACGRAILTKQAFSYAGQSRRQRGRPVIEADDLLIGVLRDAEEPLHRPRCFNNRWRRQLRSRLGLPHHGPSPVRLIVEHRGYDPAALRRAAEATLQAAT